MDVFKGQIWGELKFLRKGLRILIKQKESDFTVSNGSGAIVRRDRLLILFHGIFAASMPKDSEDSSRGKPIQQI